MTELSADTAPPVETLPFEAAQAELERVVEQLEDRATGLEQALALFERGEALHARCQSLLEYAAERLQKVTVSAQEAAQVAVEGDATFSGEPSGADAGESDRIF
jgi:exodeoxyribonuclease VII small subunit